VIALTAVAGLGAAADDLRLLDAAKRRDAAAVQALLKQRVDVNVTQPDGATALHWAAHWDDVPTAESLIRAGAHVNTTNQYNVTPLALACTNGSAVMVDLLLKAGASPNAALPSGETQLMTAARSGTTRVVAALLSKDADVNARENVGAQTALMWAAIEGHTDVARTLLEWGADVHARSKAGSTALVLAARNGDAPTSQVLLNAGADINETGAMGFTALMVATMRGHLAHAGFLLDHGANSNLGPGFTPLDWAAGEWPTELTDVTNGIIPDDTEWSPLGGLRGQLQLDMVKLLLGHGADPNDRPKGEPRYGDGVGERNGPVAEATPYLLAATSGNGAVMRLLAAAGADPKATTTKNDTALILAASNIRSTEYKGSEENYVDAVKTALDLGADINAPNAGGDTPLHIATARDSLALAKFLVEGGANVNVKNKNGWTPLTVAEGVSTNNFMANPSIIQLLRNAGAEPTPPGTDRAGSRGRR
jgi:ankyrin repeat protein